MAALELADVAAEDRRAAGGPACRQLRGGRSGLHGRRIETDAAGRGRLEVPVEVVQGQQLNLDVLGLVVMVVVALVRRGRAGEDEQKHAGRPQQAKE